MSVRKAPTAPLVQARPKIPQRAAGLPPVLCETHKTMRNFEIKKVHRIKKGLTLTQADAETSEQGA